MGLRIRNLGLDDLLVDEDLSHLLAFLFPESLDDLELVADAEVTDAEVDVVLGVVGSADLAAGLHTVSQSGLDALALGLFELIDVLTAVVAEGPNWIMSTPGMEQSSSMFSTVSCFSIMKLRTISRRR